MRLSNRDKRKLLDAAVQRIFNAMFSEAKVLSKEFIRRTQQLASMANVDSRDVFQALFTLESQSGLSPKTVQWLRAFSQLLLWETSFPKVGPKQESSQKRKSQVNKVLKSLGAWADKVAKERLVKRFASVLRSEAKRNQEIYSQDGISMPSEKETAVGLMVEYEHMLNTSTLGTKQRSMSRVQDLLR
jgi:hypothetical protein